MFLFPVNICVIKKCYYIIIFEEKSTRITKDQVKERERERECFMDLGYAEWILIPLWIWSQHYEGSIDLEISIHFTSLIDEHEATCSVVGKQQCYYFQLLKWLINNDTPCWLQTVNKHKPHTNTHHSRKVNRWMNINENVACRFFLGAVIENRVISLTNNQQ